MHRSHTLALFLVAFLAFTGTAKALVTTHTLESPNGDFKVEICIGPIDQTWAHVFYKGKKFLTLNSLGFLLDDGTPIPSVFLSREFTEKMFAEKEKEPKLHEGVRAPFPDVLKNNVAKPYHESVVEYIGLLKIIFRAYDEGIVFCYEFTTKKDKPIKIMQELTTFQFNNLYPFRKDRDVPEVLEEFQVSKIKLESIFKLDNRQPIRENRNESEVNEEMHVNTITAGYASLRIEKISDCPTLVAGEVPLYGIVPVKLTTRFQPDTVKPTTVNLIVNGNAHIEGIGRPVRSPWRFIKVEREDDMLESLDITRNRL